MSILAKLNPFTWGRPAEFREAAAVQVDADDDQWRRLSGHAERDLAPVTQDRMRKMAHFLWESNLLANRLIEVPLAYMLAKGVKVTIEDEDAQLVLKRHWRDGINAWDIKLPKKARELALFGEQCWPAFRDPVSGFVRWGYLDPGLISRVVMDPDNAEQPIGIVTRRDTKGQYRKYRVIVNVPEAAFTERTQAIRERDFPDGECLFFKVNDLCASTRGRGDLLAQSDWLDGYDHMVFGEIDRADFMRLFMWDVEIAGADEAELKAWTKKLTAPNPGSLRIHNERMKWNAVSPDLKAADMSETAKLIRNHVLGGATVPEHWYGGAGDVNRATGQSMAEPTEKVLEMRQTYIGYMLEQMATYVLRSAWGALDRELTPDEEGRLDGLQIQWPEMSAKDTSRYAAAFTQVVSGSAIAVAEGFITKATAVRLVAAMADELSVEIDPEKELENAMAELDRIREEDRFTGRDDPDPDPVTTDDDAE